MNHRCLFFTVFTVLLSVSGFAQKNKLDSLESRLTQSGADTLRVNLLNELTAHYWSKDPQRVKQNATEAQELSRKLGYKKGEAGSLVSFGIYYWTQGQHEKALDSYTHALT